MTDPRWPSSTTEDNPNTTSIYNPRPPNLTCSWIWLDHDGHTNLLPNHIIDTQTMQFRLRIHKYYIDMLPNYTHDVLKYYIDMLHKYTHYVLKYYRDMSPNIHTLWTQILQRYVTQHTHTNYVLKYYSRRQVTDDLQSVSGYIWDTIDDM
jgi:hypothetical protein